ncbi:unnamed protein product [Soboliphyme baturini]|uniref:Glyco_hydro_38C domain-containing protein n=1 Tax=Soboliphyme baturini TaxID=241478 RepID=A0A183ISH6_9BILA|nr:unnamed protein product [Soboliphyme baturini]
MVTIYNGYSHPQHFVARIPVFGINYDVFDYRGAKTTAEVFPSFNADQISYVVPGPFDLMFKATVPPLGYSSYFISIKSETGMNDTVTDERNFVQSVYCSGSVPGLQRMYGRLYGKRCSVSVPSLRQRRPLSINLGSNLKINNDFFTIHFNRNGTMKSILDKRSGKLLNISQQFFYYGAGPTLSYGRPSGAYVFQPGALKPVSENATNIVVSQFLGTLVEEMRQIFSPWVSQVIRLYKDKPLIEFEWTVGPIPLSNYGPNSHDPKEVITRYSSGISNQGEFYTDSNGHQSVRRKHPKMVMPDQFDNVSREFNLANATVFFPDQSFQQHNVVHSRRRNFQLTFSADKDESLSANYYPVTRYIYIKDHDLAMAVINDRSQGGSSVKDGSIELMLHRRLAFDDSLGVEEVLNETENGKGLVARGRHWLVIDSPTEITRVIPHLAMEMFYQPLMTFAPVEKAMNLNKQVSGLTRELPRGINVLTLAAWENDQILLRLENYRTLDSNYQDRSAVVIDLKGLFSNFDVMSLEELNLSGGKLLRTRRRQPANDLKISLFNMEIRTFACAIARKPDFKSNF